MNSSSFRTEFTIPAAPFELTLGSQVVALGSCFAQTIGKQLKLNKVPVLINPFGTVFQPLAMYNFLAKTLKGEGLDERLMLQREGRWVSYEAHSDLWGIDRQSLQVAFEGEQIALRTALEKAQLLILTLGSAWTYLLHEPPVYVANNHKQPAAFFRRDLLSVKDVCKPFAALYQQLKALNPSLQIVVTVSPVRHARDGMADNAVSKSVLRAACHYLTEDFPDTHYFPAYELLLDDLRDYRFYASDLLHPNELAEAYIFQRFAETYFSESLRKFIKEWEGIHKALEHRPFNPDSVAHRQFLQQLKQKLQRIQDQVDVQEELAEVTHLLEN